MKPGESVISPSAVDVTPGYFEAMGVAPAARPLLRRPRRSASTKKADGSHANGACSIIVDETLAKRFWPGAGSNRPPHVQAERHHQGDLTAITDKTAVLHRRRRRSPTSSCTTSPRAAKSVGAYYFPMDQDTPERPDLRGQDRRRSAVADERRARRAQRPRPRAAGVRHADDGPADGEVAGQPAIAGAAVAQLRRRRAVPVGDRDLRRAGVPRHAADARRSASASRSAAARAPSSSSCCARGCC